MDAGLRRDGRGGRTVALDRGPAGRDHRPGPILARIACPTLVVAGEHDFICGPAWNRPIAAGIGGAEYAEISGTGYLPQYEAPELFHRPCSSGWAGT